MSDRDPRTMTRDELVDCVMAVAVLHCPCTCEDCDQEPECEECRRQYPCSTRIVTIGTWRYSREDTT